MTRSIVLFLLALGLSGCAGGSAAPSHQFPKTPLAPQGWSFVGGISGDQTNGTTTAIFDFRSGPVAVHGSCAGSGTVAVVIGWPDPSGDSVATRSQTGLIPCSGDLSNPLISRLEMPAVAAGQLGVSVFMVPNINPTIAGSFSVSLEQPV